MSQTEHRDTPSGLLAAGGAYLIWGVMPIYFKAMAHMPAWEMVGHRVLWSIPVVALVLWWQRRGAALHKAITSPRTLIMAALLAVLLAFHWGIYTWAVITERTLQTALGYYVAPLVSMLLAVVFLGERLDLVKGVATALALGAFAILAVDAGGIPWIAVTIGVTWSMYAYFKRTLPVTPLEGFTLEVILLAVPALAALVWFGQTNLAQLATSSGNFAMLALSGPMTAVPLMLYALGAKGLKLSTIAVLQYMSPTLVFLVAVVVFREPFDVTKLAAMALIWIALALYTFSFLKRSAPA